MAQVKNGHNIPLLRARWLAAEREWRNAVAEAGLDLYSEAAEGQMLGRGKSKYPDALRRLFMQAQVARGNYFSPEERVAC
jgi:hypothetical protein